MENQKFVKKGAVGGIQFGYIQQDGQRNQWVVTDQAGVCFLASENNMNAACRDAQRIRYANEDAA